MRKGTFSVTLSKERWYVTADRTRAVKGDDPLAAYLLVGKGGAIAPEVAAHYGIDTYSGEAVERVAENPEHEKSRMASEGTAKITHEKYEAMRINREVRESVNSSLTTEGNRSAGRQAEMMSAGIVHAMTQEEAPQAETPQEGAEPDTRTVSIPPPPGSDMPPSSTAADPPGNEPDAGGETSTGQAGSNPLEGELELEDAKDKTL